MTSAIARQPAPSDLEIIDEVRGGDRARFALLVRRYNQRLFRAARAILGDDAEAEDAVQQAYLDAYRNLDRFRGESSFSTWLTRIAVNAAITRLHGRRRLAEVPDDVRAVPDPIETADDVVAARELAHLVERHVDALPDALRVVLVLRDLEEMDTASTAAVLGLSAEAVRVRLHRARAALQAAITADIGREIDGMFRYLGDRCDRMTARVMASIADL